jgi:quinol monooxygenase YgiN
MSEPIVFVSHFRIRDGKLDAFKQHTSDISRLLEAEKPRTSAFLPYTSDDGEVTFVHVFADADAMDAHVQGADERSKAVQEFLSPDGWEIYGKPSADVLRMLNQGATATGVSLAIQSESIGGFLRLS